MNQLTLINIIAVFLLFSLNGNCKITVLEEDSTIIVTENRVSIGVFGGIRLKELNPNTDAGFWGGLTVDVPIGDNWSIKIEPSVWQSYGYEDFSSYKEYYYKTGKILGHTLAFSICKCWILGDYYFAASIGPNIMMLNSRLFKYKYFRELYFGLNLNAFMGIRLSRDVDLNLRIGIISNSNFYGQHYEPILISLGFNYLL